MYINLQLNQDKTQLVMTVHTSLFAKNRMLHKFAATNIKFLKSTLSIMCTYISIFSKIGLVDRSKLCTQIHLQKIANCINL